MTAPDFKEASNRLRPGLADAVSSALKQLLQTKHLYQNVTVFLAKEIQELIQPFVPLKSQYAKALYGPWAPYNRAGSETDYRCCLLPSSDGRNILCDVPEEAAFQSGGRV